MGDEAGSFTPAIFLLSDGEPTDDYQHELKKLKENNWFKKAIEVSFATRRRLLWQTQFA